MGILGLSEAAVVRHGPILNDNEATGLSKVFKYLPCLRDATNIKKCCQSPKTNKNAYVGVFLHIDCLGSRAGVMQGSHK